MDDVVRAAQLVSLIVLSGCGGILRDIMQDTGSASDFRGTQIHYIEDSTQKVCQLTGDYDRSRKCATLSLTGTRGGVRATDLGSTFEHEGKLWFLFGDTKGRPGDRDAIAWTDSVDPEQIELHFPLGSDRRWLPLSVPGVSQGAFEVPSNGISIDGRMYVIFTTDHTADKTMGRSVLAVSGNDGRTFRALYTFSTDKFINAAFCEADEWIYLFGSGEYRASSVCLARIARQSIEERDKWRYAASGAGEEGIAWSPREADAEPLFVHDVVGELSVAFCAPLGCFLMLYNSSDPRGVVMRSAYAPCGPWSASTVIFHPWRDAGYGKFIHISSDFREGADSIHDPGRQDVWGGGYGPYIMERYTAGSGERCTIFYTLSTWNPYQVVIMRSDLRKR